MIDPKDNPDPADAAPAEPLDETTPPIDENFAVDLSPGEAGADE